MPLIRGTLWPVLHSIKGTPNFSTNTDESWSPYSSTTVHATQLSHCSCHITCWGCPRLQVVLQPPCTMHPDLPAPPRSPHYQAAPDAVARARHVGMVSALSYGAL